MRFKPLTVLLLTLFFLFSMVLIGCKPAGQDGEQNETDPPGQEQEQEDNEVLTDTIDETDIDKVILTPSFTVGNPQEGNSIVPHSSLMSGMVLQRRTVLRLFGTLSHSEQHIAATLNDKTYFGTVVDGNFELYIPPLEAGGPHSLVFYTENAKLTLTDIYVGEVFLMAGQSNMAWPCSSSWSIMSTEAANATNPAVRFLKIEQTTSETPLTDITAAWKPATGNTIQPLSAFAYLYGKEMYAHTNIPIGLIQSAVGSTVLAHWLPKESYDELSKTQTVYTNNNSFHFKPYIGYNGMTNPLTVYKLRGVVWYQGESNSSLAGGYQGELDALIKAYRTAFNNDKLIFNIIELPRFSNTEWSTLREAQQTVAAQLPYTCLSVNIDLGDMSDVHPRDKRIYSKRAADKTVSSFFGIKTNPFPEIEKIKLNKSTEAELVFKQVGEGLSLQNGTNGFEYSYDGYTYYKILSAEILENSIIIKTKSKIAAIRYGYKIDFDDDIKADPSKHVTVYNSFGNPLDQFKHKF